MEVKESEKKHSAPPMTWDEFCKRSAKFRFEWERAEFVKNLQTTDFEEESELPELQEAS
jgi:hypothetical protein